MKRLLFLMAICLCTFSANAQLLWEISGNGLEKPSYLYGTMHLGDERIYQFNDSLMPAFENCQLFAGELQLLDQSMFSSFGMLADMMMPNDTTLKDLMTRDQYKLVKRKLDKRLDEMGMLMFAEYFERIKPIFVSIIMTDFESQVKQAQTGGGKEPVDLYFQKLAKEKGMKVVGLETMDEQMQVFDNIPLTKQANMLYEELNKKKKDKKDEIDVDQMIDLYASEDIDSLYKLTSTGFDSDINEDLLYKRNINMANRMVPYMKKQAIFVGVGAAHLPGEGGVIDLLRKKGYTVRPVNPPKKEDATKE